MIKGVRLCVQSFATASKANLKEVKPLMGRVDTLLRSLLADFAGDDAGVHFSFTVLYKSYLHVGVWESCYTHR